MLTYTKNMHILMINSVIKAEAISLLVLERDMTDSLFSIPVSSRLQRLFPPGSNHSSSYWQAIVTDPIYPHKTGRVKFLGTWWNALCKQDIVLVAGTTVYVVDLEGLTLVVQLVPPISYQAD